MEAINDNKEHEDELIMDTANDALYSKASAVNSKYYEDEYLNYFIKSKRKSFRKGPIINRGTFLRVNTIDNSVKDFLKENSSKKQVVSLGAGYDTRYFYLKELMNDKNLKYFEIDFPKLVKNKINHFLSEPQLNQKLINIELDNDSTYLNSANYCLLSGDLKDFELVVESLKKFGFDQNLPTFFISECVLIYLDPTHSDQIISWISANCKKANIITYEQILPNDDFGKMMLQNLKMRGVELKGIYKYPTLESQVQRFKNFGFATVTSISLLQSERELLTPTVISHLNQLERLDEVEEWELICNHYCFTEAKNY